MNAIESLYFSGVLDVNGSSVSSDEITNYFLHKIKNTGNNDQDSYRKCLFNSTFIETCQ